MAEEGRGRGDEAGMILDERKVARAGDAEGRRDVDYDELMNMSERKHLGRRYRNLGLYKKIMHCTRRVLDIDTEIPTVQRDR